MSQTTYVLIFSFLHWIKRCKEPHVLEVLVWSVEDSGGSWLLFWFLIMMGRGQECPKQPMFQSWAFYIEYKGAKNPRIPGLRFRRIFKVPDWSFGSWSWWGGVKNVPNNLSSYIQHSTLNKKVQRTLMSLKSWSGVGEDCGCSWLGFWFLIMIGRFQQCTKLPMFQNSALYIE